MNNKPSYYEDIRTLGSDLKNIGLGPETAIKNGVTSYLYESTSLNPIFKFIESYLVLLHKEIKRFKLLYNYTEKPETKRVNH